MPGSIPESGIAEAGIAEAGADEARLLSGRGLFARRFLHSPRGLAGLTLTLALGAVAAFAGLIAPGDPLALGQPALRAPSAAHPMGTDNLGRELFTAVVHGTRTSLTVVLWVVVISSVLGILIGAISGYRGGLIDDLLMRFTELVQVVPRFFLAIMVIALFGPGLDNLIILLGLTSWPLLARVVRAETLSLKELEFVEAARSYGASATRILARHVVPNVMPSTIVVVTLMASRVILIEATLSFLGLGDQNRISWGFLASNANNYLDKAWWMSVFPGGGIAVAVLGFNLLGDGVTDALRPGARYSWRM